MDLQLVRISNMIWLTALNVSMFQASPSAMDFCMFHLAILNVKTTDLKHFNYLSMLLLQFDFICCNISLGIMEYIIFSELLQKSIR